MGDFKRAITPSSRKSLFQPKSTLSNLIDVDKVWDWASFFASSSPISIEQSSKTLRLGSLNKPKSVMSNLVRLEAMRVWSLGKVSGPNAKSGVSDAVLVRVISICSKP